ncbi:MAG: DNA polymerase I [Candidatus Ryanbacteria bacterium]|nr:DNA polymerase I [Candidatus Ryanbacteria bacterium]
MPADKKTLVILDAHAFIHRAYHALPSFTSPSGEPMGAVYGVALVLLKLLRELSPTYIVAAFDREEPTFRHTVYEQYKATRAETKSDLVPQFDKVRELFRAFKIPVLDAAGFEADDIIGTLCELFQKEKNLSIIIASGDMDTLQLVSGERVKVYTLKKGLEDTVIYDEEAVRARFGFAPKLIVDFKGLKGDPSDNIIGVKGIGEKTATELIKHYGSIEEMYARLKAEKKTPAFLKERIKKLLFENEDEALFSKELATVRRDAPVNPALADLAYEGIPTESVAAAFRKFHFPSLLARLDTPKPKESEARLELRDLESSKIGLFLEGGHAVAYDGKHEYAVERLDALKDKKDIVAHDAKTIFHLLGLLTVGFDTKIAAWVLDPDRRALELKDLGANIFAVETKLRRDLARQKLWDIYEKFELPLMPILFEMERVGILLDTKALADLEYQMARELEKLAEEIYASAGERFDINSPKQLSRILFDVLKLSTKGIRKTSTRAVSTQFSELTKLRGAHPVVDMVIRHREIAKLLSTYVGALPKLVGKDGRVHTTYIQTGTATGRISSQNPNLQNIPIKSELGKSVRRAFVADIGYELVSFDYSQLELRIAAELSKDETLTRAFRNGEDIHARTAAKMFNKPIDAVSPEERRRAKTINFGILYGMGSRALAESLHISGEEAARYLDEYFSEFPAVAEFRDHTIEAGRKNGFVETFFGRKRFLPNLRSSFEYVRKEAERQAQNAPIQGTASDLIKRAMIDIFGELQLGPQESGVRMLLQVHDELVFEIKKNQVAEAASRIRDIMERVPEFSVPIVVDVKSGPNWQDMKPIA